MSRQGRNASVVVGSGGAFGEYTYDDDPDDIDDGLTNMASIYFKPDVSFTWDDRKDLDRQLIIRFFFFFGILGICFGQLNEK